MLWRAGLGMKRLYLGKNEIVFAIFGGGSAYGAKRFG
jgi:hypothetical protein